MAKQRYVNTHFWDDGYVVKLSPIQKLLFLYVLTNPLTNIAGAYEITTSRIAFDTGIDEDQVEDLLLEFSRDGKIIFRNDWLLIPNFIKNQSLTPKIVKGIEEVVKCCPHWIKDTLSIRYERLSHLNSNLNSNLNTNTNAGEAASEVVCAPLTETEKRESKFTEEIIDGIKKRLDVTFSLPNEGVWYKAASWAFVNGYSPAQFTACYDHLKSQSWRTGRITAANVQENLPEYVLSQQAGTGAYVNPMTGRGLK